MLPAVVWLDDSVAHDRRLYDALLEDRVAGAFEVHIFGDTDAAVEFTIMNKDRIFMFVQDSTRPPGRLIPAWKALRRRDAPSIGWQGHQGDFHVHVVDAFTPRAGAVFAGFSFSDAERDFIIEWSQVDRRVCFADKMTFVLGLRGDHPKGDMLSIATEQLERWQAMDPPPSGDSELFAPLAEELVTVCGARPPFLDAITPREFETVIAAIFKNHGFAVELTACTSDGGYDVMAVSHAKLQREVTLVEVKHFAPHRPVSVGIVRALYGTKCLNNADKA